MVLRITLAIIAGFVFLSSVNAGEGWYSSYDEARSTAERESLPLLIHFHASYCGPCRQMSAQVFSQAEVQRQLRDGIAAVEIDVQHRPDLVAKYRADTVPRDVVVFPDGTSETVNIGFKSTFAYRDLLRSVARRGARFAKVEPANRENIDRVDVPEKTETRVVVGLEGFCPVQLIKKREWVTGKKDLTESYRGITYHFSTEDARGEFRRNPRKYSPQNLGCDPVTLFANQQAISGQIRFGAFFDNQLFLFESADNRKTFKDNPLKYGRIRHALKIDDLSNRKIQ